MKRLLIDLDGTLYRGDKVIEGADAFISKLQSEKISFLLLTNCPLNSPMMLKKKLGNMGIFVDVEQILSSGSVCAEYIEENYHGKTVFVVGSASFAALIEGKGGRLCSMDDNFADVVAVGHTENLEYAALCYGASCIRNGAAFLATNLDATIPHGENLVPHTGAVVSYLETSSGKSPFVVGKPFPYMLEAARKKLNCRKEDFLMIGDGLDTDYAFAVRNGIDFRIVLSGVTDREAALKRGVSEEKLCETLSEIKIR